MPMFLLQAYTHKLCRFRKLRFCSLISIISYQIFVLQLCPCPKARFSPKTEENTLATHHFYLHSFFPCWLKQKWLLIKTITGIPVTSFRLLRSDNKSRREKEHVEASWENGNKLLCWSERIHRSYMDDSFGKWSWWCKSHDKKKRRWSRETSWNSIKCCNFLLDTRPTKESLWFPSRRELSKWGMYVDLQCIWNGIWCITTRIKWIIGGLQLFRHYNGK